MKYRFLLFSVLFSFFFSNNGQSQSLKGDTIDVLNYNINLDIVYLSKKTITGFTELTINPKVNNLSKLSLDLLKLDIDSITSNNALITNYSYNDTLLVIHNQPAVSISDTFLLRVYYHGTPVVESYNWGGFHFENDSSLAYNLGVAFYAYPHCYGRVWFPCLDEFPDRASYQYHIRVKNDKLAVCGGILQSIDNHTDGTKTYHWKLDQQIPTYLASVAISNYAVVTDTFNGINGPVPTHLYVRPQDSLKAKASFIHLNNMLSIFESRFGPYKWPRVGYVSTIQGAMEHACNIAIPVGMFTGNLTYEWLYAHELSHHWFGDLVTCATQEDMWLNEGWAVFCEAIFTEGLNGYQAYKDYSRANHENVLQYAHTTQGDGSYLAVYGIPKELTYGTTVYDKGASMAHNLRGHLGDSLFFATMKAYLMQYSFKPATTANFRDFVTSYSGINMNDWFTNWIFTPGFPHFSIDSFQVVSQPNQTYLVTIFSKQKTKGRTYISNSNRVPVWFMDNNQNLHQEVMEISGVNDYQSFTIPFNPECVMMDLEERILDATTDQYKTIKTTGLIDFVNTKFKLDVTSIADSAFVRVEHNWVAPDPLKTPIAGLTLSDYRYWKVDGIFPAGFVAKGRFQYSKNSFLDNTLLVNPTSDSLIILYRGSSVEDWQPVAFQKSGSATSGYMIVSNLKRGEYTLAMWDAAHLGIKKNQESEFHVLTVFPNPSNQVFEFQLNNLDKGMILVHDTSGKEIKRIEIEKGRGSYSWNAEECETGVYFVSVISTKNKVLAKEKLILKKNK